MTLLGFDFGTHKIGIAVGQSITGTATPLMTIQAKKRKPDWDQINRLVEEWHPDEMVVGLPFEMTGNEAEIADKAKRFSRQLQGRYQLPVHLIDEKLTSREAWDRLGHQAMAAKLILETWLSEHQEAS